MTPEAFITHKIIGLIIYILASAADWYTTKRLLVDKNLKALEKGQEAPHKELNPLVKMLLGKPDKADEWRFLAYKAVLAVPVFIAVFTGGVGPGWIYVAAAPSLLAAINNKWKVISKIKSMFE